MKTAKRALSLLLSLMLVLGTVAVGMNASALEIGTFLRLGDIKIIENGEIKTASDTGWSFEESGNGGILNFDNFEFEYENGAVITAQNIDLTITGNANLTSTDEVASAIVVLGGNLTMNGNFRLRSQHRTAGALDVYGNLTIDGGYLEVINGDYDAIAVKYKMTVNSGSVYARSEKSGNRAVTAGEFIFNNDETFVLGDANAYEAMIAPYVEISSYPELKAFASRVNSGEAGIYAKLTNDIDASASRPSSPNYTAENAWTPIGNDNNSYTGTFDGCGYAIIELFFDDSAADYVGLFGYIHGGVVKNISLASGIISGHDYVGGVAGYNKSGLVENCYSSGNASGRIYVGGMVGYNCDGGSISNCFNAGRVLSSWSAGGIAAASSQNCLISGCCNTGVVSSSAYVGGIAGQNNGNSLIKGCYNTANFTVNDDGTRVGGVVGHNGDSKVQICYNTGRIEVIKSGIKAGGVVGYNDGLGLVECCYNTGDIWFLYGYNGYDHAGGVVGYNGIYGTVRSCYNTGNISCNGDVGGVVGYSDAADGISYCFYDTDRSPGIDAIGYYVMLDDLTAVTGLTTAQMTNAGEFINRINESILSFPSPWFAKENDDSYLYYPHLTGFNKDSQGNQLAAEDIAAENWPARAANDKAENGGETTVKAVDCESEITTDYKESRRFVFETENMPTSAAAHVYYNGEDRGEGTSIFIKEPKDDYTVECKVLDAEGNEIASSGEIKVMVKHSFFDKIKWFFNNLLRILIKAIIDGFGKVS